MIDAITKPFTEPDTPVRFFIFPDPRNPEHAAALRWLKRINTPPYGPRHASHHHLRGWRK